MIGDTHLQSHHLAVLSEGPVSIRSTCDNTRIALIGGESLGHRYIEWNFVSSRKDRIEQAKEDWKHKRFPTVPGDDKEFIPYP